MRCPKCGYITFDRLERCGKCAHDLVTVAAQLRGPMAKAAAPMFLGGLLRVGEGAVAEAEPVTFDLDEEALDLGEMGLEAEAVTLEEEEAPPAEAAEEEPGIAMPSLSGIDVSDLMPPQEGAEPVPMPEEEELSGIAMPEMMASEETAPEAAVDEGLSLNFDLTGGETRGEAELEAQEEAAGGVLDLADLLGMGSEEPAAEEPAAAGGEADDLSLLLEDAPPTAPATAESGQASLSLEPSETELNLTFDDAPPPAPPEADPVGHPEIPDLGLSLESDGEDETPPA